MTDGTNKLIYTSTAEFLIFTGQSSETRYEDESVWLMQKLMAIATNPTFTAWAAAK